MGDYLMWGANAAYHTAMNLRPANPEPVEDDPDDDEQPPTT
jgi:hypothetical protein